VRVAGDQFDPGQAPGGQRLPERQPAGAVLGGGDVDAQDLPVALDAWAPSDYCLAALRLGRLAAFPHRWLPLAT
jgi:hypothetical protein